MRVFKSSFNKLLTFSCLVFLISNLSACSKSSWFAPEASQDAKRTIVAITNNYLLGIARGRPDQVTNMINWSIYGKTEEQRRTRQSVSEKVNGMKGKWEPKNNPFVNLNITSLESTENSATLILQKFSGEPGPEIKIEVDWAGFGWMIVNDSIFGKGGYAEELIKIKG